MKMFDTTQDPVTLHTNGRGFWSRVAKAVTIDRIRLAWVNSTVRFGELCVYFDAATWDVTKQGLIYTDPRFISELRAVLAAAGLDAEDVDYSEQGMQGANYVSLDVGPKFIASLQEKFPAELTRAYQEVYN